MMDFLAPWLWVLIPLAYGAYRGFKWMFWNWLPPTQSEIIKSLEDEINHYEICQTCAVFKAENRDLRDTIRLLTHERDLARTAAGDRLREEIGELHS